MNESSPRFRRREKRSSVLVLTLLLLVLVSVIVLGLLASVTLEKQLAESTYEQRRAMEMSVMGYQAGVSQLRNALGTGTNSWDNPYANFCTNSPTFFWSVSPGMVTRWSYSQAAPLTNIALFSYVGPANTNLVNLNRPLEDGSYPIIGGANPPDVKVQFVNVLQDPTQTASAANPIIGRYAFWIDDESAKINVNVADGTQKYTTNSLGLGSPTEVSLQVLSQGGSTLSTTEAQSIVQMARTNSFHSPREILSVPGTTTDLYTNNVFNVTDYSRSPDLNVFGQPKMALLPILGGASTDNNPYGTNMVINGISLLAENEIYPTPSQLPHYYVNDYSPAYTASNPQVESWPLAFRAESPSYVMGTFEQDLSSDDLLGRLNNHPFNNGMMIANYMAGTNAGGMPINWPVFPGVNLNANGAVAFPGKYSNRQIDEMVIQMISISSKLTSSDYPYPNSGDYPGYNIQGSGEDGNVLSYQPTGYHYNFTPYMFPGWLSKQFVIGMGRGPKVTRLAMTVAAFSSTGTPATPGYDPPYMIMNNWVEDWIPGAYRGGFPAPSLGNFLMRQEPLNIADRQISAGVGAALFKAAPDSLGNTNSYWCNQMLTNNQGIDFSADINYNPYGPNYIPDPDQSLAKTYHDPWALYTNSSGNPEYHGAIPFSYNGNDSPLDMDRIQAANDPQEWGVNTTNPGQMRCAQTQEANSYNPNEQLRMITTADGGTLNIGGGLSVHGSNLGGPYFSDPDPVPLETIRAGTINPPGVFSGDTTFDGVPNSVPRQFLWSGTWGMTGSPPGTTVRERHIASVVPVNINLSVPAANTIVGNATNIYLYTSDPLVNKFPGDWKQGYNANVPFPDPVSPPTSANLYYQYYSETNYLQDIAAANGDPDSFWLPQMDVGFCPQKSMIAGQTLIPRSQRMPNVGYLQYVRTGIVPDDETADYSTQHGTPFRLFSYGSSGDASQTVRGINYPDWALLDLFYVPSILYSYGGPYAGQTNLAPFGTYGGATAGRINPNGCVIYTTNTSVPSAVLRTLPLQATLNGLHVNQSFNGTVDHPDVWGWSDVNGTTVLDSAASSTLAGSIAQYIHDNGPLREPGEICNISAVTALKAPENVLGTRNDLVRQMVGELTTQSNVFSVWTVGQVVQKIPGNTQYGEFESGDHVLGEVRFHFVVERYLDPGADGIYGNSKNPGADSIVGSFDDPVDANHPFEPRYLYRVVRSEELR